MDNMKQKVMNRLKMVDFKWVLIIVFILILSLFGYLALYKANKTTNNNILMAQSLDTIPISITSFNDNDGNYQHNLRDYYVMSSYNSCCGGNFQNSFVDYKPLQMVIKRGARVLDFEIYSVNNETVIAASDNENFYQKGTYNSLPFADVMNKIDVYAFSSSTCPNPNDPLFLHFRIKSKQPHVYTDMTKALFNTFLNKKLGKEYAYEYGGENLGLIPLKEFKGKVIIMCSRENNMFSSTPLNEYVNIASGSQFLRELRNYDVQYTHNFNELIDSNKKNMAITMPDLAPTDANMPVSLHLKYGCQMPCMNFQNLDSNLQYYLKYFNDRQFAFVLKPAPLRYIPKIMKKPAPQNPKLSYARRVIQKPYFKHQI